MLKNAVDFVGSSRLYSSQYDKQQYRLTEPFKKE